MMTYVRLFPLLVCASLLAGCATPVVHEPSRTTILDPDAEDNIGGTFLESSDIRTIAQQMTSAILSTPQISSGTDVKRIALAPVRNDTRFLIDSQLFLTRLRIELNRVSQGRVRFFMQENAQPVRRQILLEQNETEWNTAADEIAGYLLKSMPSKASQSPLRLAMGATKNTNIKEMNSESFLAMVRSRLAERAAGRVVFVSDQVSQLVQKAMNDNEEMSHLNVDYVLCGEFLAEAMQVAEGKQELELEIKEKREVFGQTYSKEDTKEETLRFERRQNPNVTKRFNCQLVDSSNKLVVCEKMISLDKKMQTGIGTADYILTGAINALSKATQGALRSDYIVVSFQLVDPASNEMLWEDAYESKRSSRVGTVYR